MDLTNEEYAALVRRRMPRSPLWKDVLAAFLVGGAICCVGQGFLAAYRALGADAETAAGWECVTMVFLGALLTGLGVYDRIARFAGAGTLVPITGFANAVASPALEYRTEGLVTGLAAKIFTVAGPVIVCGVAASALYGAALLLFGLA